MPLRRRSTSLLLLGSFIVLAIVAKIVDRGGESLRGAVIGERREGDRSIFTVQFPAGSETVTLRVDDAYLIEMPNEAGIAALSPETAIRAPDGSPARYFGYEYASAEGETEHAERGESRVRERFPGRFFASQRLIEENAITGDLTAFAQANGVTIVSGATLRFRPGFLYALRLDDDNAILRVRGTPQNAAASSAPAVSSATSAAPSSSASSARFDVFLRTLEAPVPITYAPDRGFGPFPSEGELHGYNPGFRPNVVNFTADGRHIAVRQGTKLQVRAVNAGPWDTIDFAAGAKAAVLKLFSAYDGGTWDWSPRESLSYDDRVVFDVRGCGYTFLRTTGTTLSKGAASVRLAENLLLVTPDLGERWTAYRFPVTGGASVRLEADAGFPLEKPPAILVFNSAGADGTNAYIPTNRTLSMHLPQSVPTEADPCAIALGAPIEVSKDSALLENHSGAGNSVVTAGDLTIVTWPGATALRTATGAIVPGTPAYVRVFDRSMDPPQAISDRILIGFGGIALDGHNTPAICRSSNDRLFAVLAGHHDPMQWTETSLDADRYQTWTAPARIGEPAVRTAGGWQGYTYSSLACDQAGNAHILSRWSGDGYRFRLAYLTRNASGAWKQFAGKNHRILVDPVRVGYAAWRQKLSVDPSTGDVYAFYAYSPNNFSPAEEAVAREKGLIGATAAPLNPPMTAGLSWFESFKDFNFTVLKTSNGGESWRFVE